MVRNSFVRHRNYLILISVFDLEEYIQSKSLNIYFIRIEIFFIIIRVQQSALLRRYITIQFFMIRAYSFLRKIQTTLLSSTNVIFNVYNQNHQKQNNLLPMCCSSRYSYYYSSVNNKSGLTNNQKIEQLENFKQHHQAYKQFIYQKNVKMALEELQKVRSVILEAKCHESTKYIQVVTELIQLSHKNSNYPRVKELLIEGCGILQNLEGTHAQLDGFKLNLYGNMSDLYFHQNSIEEAIRFSKECQPVLVRLGLNNSGQAGMFYQNIGQMLIMIEKYEECLTYFLKSKQLFDKFMPEQAQLHQKHYHNIAFAYFNLNQLEKSVEAHKEQLQFTEKLYGRNSIYYAEVCSGISMIMVQELKIYDQSLPYLQTGFKIAKDQNMLTDRRMLQIIEGLSIVYIQTKRYEQAITYLAHCLKYYEVNHLQSQYKYKVVMSNIAECYKQCKKYKMALKYFQDLFNKVNQDQKQYAYVIGSIGQIYAKQQKYQESLQKLLTSLKIDKELNGNQQTLYSHHLYKLLIQVGNKLNRKQMVEEYAKLLAEYQEKNKELLSKQDKS